MHCLASSWISCRPFHERTLRDEGTVKRGPVAAPVVDYDAFPSRRGHDHRDDPEHLVVFACVPGRARRPELEGERDRLALPRLAGDGHAPVVAVDEHRTVLLRRPARVPDARDVLHAVADLGRVDEDERVVLHVPGAFGQDGFADGRAQAFVGEVAAQSLFDGMAHAGVVVYRAHD